MVPAHLDFLGDVHARIRDHGTADTAHAATAHGCNQYGEVRPRIGINRFGVAGPVRALRQDRGMGGRQFPVARACTLHGLRLDASFPSGGRRHEPRRGFRASGTSESRGSGYGTSLVAYGPRRERTAGAHDFRGQAQPCRCTAAGGCCGWPRSLDVGTGRCGRTTLAHGPRTAARRLGGLCLASGHGPWYLRRRSGPRGVGYGGCRCSRSRERAGRSFRMGSLQGMESQGGHRCSFCRVTGRAQVQLSLGGRLVRIIAQDV